jgi:sec-independent protein translocase protein TatB
MFDISFPELVVVCVIALLVLGPERLPGALRTLGLWVGRISRTFVTMKAEIEREIGMDDIRRQLHNEAVMDEVKRLEREVRGEAGNGAKHAEAATPDSVALGSHPDASTAPAAPAAPAAPTSHAPTRV